MRGRDKLSLITFVFFWFLGLYVIVKFFLILFWTLNFSPVFIIELTPFTVFNLGPIQLLVLSAIVVGADAYLHFNDKGWHVLYSFVPTSLMIAGIAIAIYNSHYDDPFYYSFFAMLVGITVVDHRYLLRINGYAPEEEEEEEKEIPEEPEELEFDIDELYGGDEEGKSEAEPEEPEEAWEWPEEEEETNGAGEVMEDLSKIESGPEVVPDIIHEMDTKAYETSETSEAFEELEDLVDLFDENGNEESPEEETGPVEEKEDIQSFVDLLLGEEMEETRLKCPACGFMNEKGSTVCKVCGSKLEEKK